MPAKPAPPTIEEVKQIVRDELAKCHARIDSVANALTEHKVIADARRDATAQFVAQIRKQLRDEIAKAQIRPAEEFFYTDDDSADGVKRDADLHNPILRAVDYPIDEKIMGPIRAKHRAKYLAEQRAKRARSARVIDLPALPLRGRHG
ncbi:hypothetical protein [Bradyrhizobium sp. S3.14.4]